MFLLLCLGFRRHGFIRISYLVSRVRTFTPCLVTDLDTRRELRVQGAPQRQPNPQGLRTHVDDAKMVTREAQSLEQYVNWTTKNEGIWKIHILTGFLSLSIHQDTNLFGATRHFVCRLM